MVDWTRIIGFDWDAGKSSDKHEVSQAEAEQVFFSVPLSVVPDTRHSSDEPRLHALGKTDEGRRLHVTVTLRSDETLIRVTSARDMHQKERRIYADTETQDPQGTADQPHQGAPDENGSSVRK